MGDDRGRPGAGGDDRGVSGAGAGAMNPGDEVPPGSPASGEAPCRACAGSGRRDGEPCAECGGTGRVVVAVSAGP